MKEEAIDIGTVGDDLLRAYEQGLEDGKPKWIPVTDRLPDKNMWCLVICNERGGAIRRIAAFLEGFLKYRFEENGCDISRFVTHWMSLPEPPKDGE